jgi:SecD/SecF fusion protein
MSEVFTRSLATSFVVLMPVGSLLLFGGETLKDFAFALLVGVLSGAYSSIFIATPVLVEWKEREQTYMRRRRLMLEQFGGRIPAFPPGVLGEPEPATAGAPVAAATAVTPRSEAPTGREARRQRRAAGSATPSTRTATRPAPPPPSPPPPSDGGDGDGGRSPAETPASPAAPAAPSEPPAKPRQSKPKSKRQGKRRKHGRR